MSMSDIAMSRKQRHMARKRVNTIALGMSVVAMGFGLVWLTWILADVLIMGVSGLSWSVLTQMTPPPDDASGGLANAIVGSISMVLLAALIGTPIGICAGVYLAESRSRSVLAGIVRFINDILLSAPSIVVGLFVYAIAVAPFKTFSGFAGILSLSLLIIPVVVRTTENVLRLVPNSLREAAFALGTPKWRIVLNVTLETAKSGVITGVLLAVARVSGETAPLLFTSLSNQFWSLDLRGPLASLPVTIFKFSMSPYDNWQQLAWAGVFLITMGVLVTNILARRLFSKR